MGRRKKSDRKPKTLYLSASLLEKAGRVSKERGICVSDLIEESLKDSLPPESGQ